jgi:myo-inositol-1(or 4)-monophosphatase
VRDGADVTAASETIDQASLANDLALLKDAAAEAGKIALRYFGKNPGVWMKDGSSPVSEADIEVDRYLRERLMAARPDHGWLSEETADNPARLQARRTFVIDPIDGTRAFIDGRETWCVAIAIVEAGRPIAGVLDCPAKGEVYAATSGGGAFKNGARLTVRQPQGQIVVAGPKPLLDAAPESLQRRWQRVSYIPSLAYRVAMVADGSLHATFVKPSSKDWDLAAADLILEEAGGKILDARGNRLAYAGKDVTHGVLVAGSGELLGQMAAVIRDFKAGQ